MHTRKRRLAAIGLGLAALSLAGAAPRAHAAEGTVYSLDRCIAIAQERNPEIAIANQSYVKSESTLLMSYGGLLPGFSMDFSTGHRFYGPSSVEVDASGRPVRSSGFDYDSYAFGLNSDIQLFNGGSNIYRIRSAMSGRDAAREDLTYRRSVIAASVIRAYYDLVRAKMLLTVQEESVESARRNQERAEALMKVGSATRADVLRARVRFSNTRLSVIEAQNAIDLAKEDLAVVLALDRSDSIDVDTTITIEYTEIDPEAETQHAMVYRPDLRSLDYGIKSAHAGVSAARGGWYPSIGAAFNYSWNDRKMATDLNFFKNEYTWGVAAYLNFNIFDRFQTRSNVASAKADARIAEYSLARARNEATRQVKSLCITIDQARERIALGTETVEQATEDLRLAEERYRVGAGTMLETIDAQVVLTQAKADVVQAKCDFLIATADLAVATGKRIYR